MKNKIVKIFVAFYLVFLPVMSFAQDPNITVNFNTGNQSSNSCVGIDVNSIQELFALATCILIKSLWPLLLTAAVVVFIIGVVKYIAGADEEAKRTEGKNFMIYGLIALFVMVSVWGLVGIIQGTFGLESTPIIPQLPQ